MQARETIATPATAAPQAPPQMLLDPESWPSMFDGADAPDLDSILDSVYRAPQAEAPAIEAPSRTEPLGEAPQNFPLVIVEPPVVRVMTTRRRRKRRAPLVQRVRENTAARRTIYALWAVALVVVVWLLLQMAR